jgi:hypothetical protein
MKEEYEDLEMEIIEFGDEDVITTSTPDTSNQLPISFGS